MQNNQNGQKTTFKWPKRVPKVIFPRFWGVIWSIKVVSDFRFGDQKCLFRYPQNRTNCPILRFWGYQKWHFRCPKRKSETTFIDQITPLNLEKNTLGTHFGHLKVVFWPFWLFCTFLLESKSWRKQTCFKIQLYVGIQLRWTVFEQLWFSASPNVEPCSTNVQPIWDGWDCLRPNMAILVQKGHK